MRYKVRFGNSLDMFAVCYAGNQAEAVAEFHKYHPHLTVTSVEEFPEEQPTVDLYDLIEDCDAEETTRDAEETIRYLIKAIDEAGATDRVAGYLRRHGFG